MKAQYMLFIIVSLAELWFSQGQSCITRKELSGRISDYVPALSTKCWKIIVPDGSYTRIQVNSLNTGNSCPPSSMKIQVLGTGESYTLCSADTKPITALSDVNITVTSQMMHYTVPFNLNYTTESILCGQKDHFRCSINYCIHRYQVCNGVRDCPNGADEVGCETGIAAIKGVNASCENGVKWLKSHRTGPAGWGRNTHRAVVALYLAEAFHFKGNNLEEDLIVKQLELQTSVAILRNSTDAISVNELSMFINALAVTCFNPRNFYGYNLLQLLSDRLSSSASVTPGAYLALCNANWTISESQTQKLVHLLSKNSEYPFQSDVQALAMMALTCIKQKTSILEKITNATQVYNATLQKFIASQLSDGSFGNPYTTAIVTQALLSGGQENNKQWNLTSTVQYLMRQINSTTTDLVLTSLILPILNGKSLTDLTTIDCTKNHRIHGKDDEISDILNRVGDKMRVQFSLYIGDQKEVIHAIYLRMPENSTVYDVMRVAQVADPKYKFQHKDQVSQMYVYEIAGITNDPEAGLFWLLYTKDSKDDKIHHHNKSPDKYILKNEEQLIMWYRTVPI